MKARIFWAFQKIPDYPRLLGRCITTPRHHQVCPYTLICITWDLLGTYVSCCQLPFSLHAQAYVTWYRNVWPKHYGGRIRGVSEKFQDWCHKWFISNTNYKLQVVPFKVIPLESNDFPILLCPACMHSWKDSSRTLRSSVVTAFLMSCTSSKWSPWWPPWAELGEEKKVTWSQVGRVGKLLQHGDVLLGQELLDAQGSVSRRVVMVKHPRVILRTERSKCHSMSL